MVSSACNVSELKTALFFITQFADIAKSAVLRLEAADGGRKIEDIFS
jgi:hypothetical protein